MEKEGGSSPESAFCGRMRHCRHAPSFSPISGGSGPSSWFEPRSMLCTFFKSASPFGTGPGKTID